MSFADHERRLDEAVLAHLTDGITTYTTASGKIIPEIRYILERDLEVYDEDGVAQRINAISVAASEVPESEAGDLIETPGRKWTVWSVLADDGHWRRLRVA